MQVFKILIFDRQKTSDFAFELGYIVSAQVSKNFEIFTRVRQRAFMGGKIGAQQA
jgi:hypothetical protein